MESWECCKYSTPTVAILAGHAYAAAISACATGGKWEQAVALFEEMMQRNIKPDVVSCTALITALAADGQWRHAERVMEFMIQSGKSEAWTLLFSLYCLAIQSTCRSRLLRNGLLC